jgi:hypothetical protein
MLVRLFKFGDPTLFLKRLKETVFEKEIDFVHYGCVQSSQKMSSLLAAENF